MMLRSPAASCLMRVHSGHAVRRVAPALRSLSTSAATSQAAPAEPPKMVKLSINGQEVEVIQGSSIMQACHKAGFAIPHFCYHERVRIC